MQVRARDDEHQIFQHQILLQYLSNLKSCLCWLISCGGHFELDCVSFKSVQQFMKHFANRLTNAHKESEVTA